MKETFVDRLRNRLSPSHARRAIKAFRPVNGKIKIDYLVVKEMSELEERYRTKARHAIQALRAWEGGDALRHMNAVYLRREREFLVSEAQNAVSLWADIRRDYREIRDMAIAEIVKPANDRTESGW